MNVGFSNRFFVYQIKGAQCLLSNKIEKDKGAFFYLSKLRFLKGFENDNISSSKSYTATKSEISPQRKLGSLRNLKP